MGNETKEKKMRKRKWEREDEMNLGSGTTVMTCAAIS